VVFVQPSGHRRAAPGHGDIVDLVSEFDGEERRATDFRVVPYPTPVGNAAAYYPETNPWCR
jgi:hypothetical protein